MPDPRYLRAVLRPPDPQPDADLLGRFVADRDADAFTVLVRRHGPMVLSVCRRVLGCAHDADDAFQATFLVLARRAGAVRPRSLLANWLYGVAYRTALEARRAAIVRRVKEQRAAGMRDAAVVPTDLEPDLRELLDRELAALPDVYRAAVVVCDLEGLGRKDAAARLGWTEGTLSGRLARARAILAKRLARHGLAVGAGALGAVAGPGAVACLPAGLAEATVRVGVLVAAGEAAAVVAPVAALTEGVMKAMLLTKLKGMASVMVVGCAVLVTAAAGWRAEAGAVQDRPADKAPAKAKSRNPDKDRIAELERERDRLLKLVADLQDRLTALEADQKKAKRGDTFNPIGALVGSRVDPEIVPALEPQTTTPTPKPRNTPQPQPGSAPTVTPNTTTPALPAGNSGLRPAASTPALPTLDVPATAAPTPSSGRPLTRPQPLPSQPGDRALPLPESANTTPPTTALPSPGLSTAPSGSPTLRSPKLDSPSATNTPAASASGVTKVYAVEDLAADEKQAAALIKVVQRAVAPLTWDTHGGPGVIDYFAVGKSLVVKNTPDAHKQLTELLTMLREVGAKNTTTAPSAIRP